MSLKTVFQVILQKRDEYIEDVFQLFKEKFDLCYQKYEDELKQQYETSKSDEHEKALQQFQVARDKFLAHNKQILCSHIENVHYNEYLTQPHVLNSMDEAGKALSEMRIDWIFLKNSTNVTKKTLDDLKNIELKAQEFEMELKDQAVGSKTEVGEIFTNRSKNVRNALKNLKAIEVPFKNGQEVQQQ